MVLKSPIKSAVVSFLKNAGNSPELRVSRNATTLAQVFERQSLVEADWFQDSGFSEDGYLIMATFHKSLDLNNFSLTEMNLAHFWINEAYYVLVSKIPASISSDQLTATIRKFIKDLYALRFWNRVHVEVLTHS